MKVNGEIFLERFNQYKIKETAVLVSGNELSLITKIESLIIKDLAGNFVNKKVVWSQIVVGFNHEKTFRDRGI